MRLWIFASGFAGLATFAVLSGLRSYPLDLGLMSGVGVAALVFASWQTVKRLRDQMEREKELRASLEGSGDDETKESDR